MIDDLKFVQGAVARKDFVQALTHFNIHNGRIKGFNGSMALCSPIGLELDVKPKAGQLVKAIQMCKETVQINMTPAGRLSISSGKFRAHVDCIGEDFPDVEPEGEVLQLDGHLLEAIKVLNPFIAEDASRPWARGILFNGPSAFATNNVVLVQYWLGYSFPYIINIPKPTVQELIRINKEPTSVQVSPSSVTFHYEGDRWLRTQTYTTEWPDLTRVLDRPSDPQPLPTGFYEALETLLPFVDDVERVFVQPTGLTTSQTEGEGASVEMEGLPDTGIYNIKQLQLLQGVASKIDLQAYPAPCAFYGDSLRGAIVGLRS